MAQNLRGMGEVGEGGNGRFMLMMVMWSDLLYVSIGKCMRKIVEGSFNCRGLQGECQCAGHLFFFTIPHTCLFLPPLSKQPGQFWFSCCGSFVT